MNRELVQSTLSYVQTTSQALGEAAAMVEEQQRIKAACEAVIPDVVDALRRANLIRASEVKQAADELARPDTALQILRETLQQFEQRSEKSAAAESWQMGGPMPSKAPAPEKGPSNVVILSR
jgi:hypothetical protein